MIYITGDKHADFHDIYEFCINNKTSKDDIIIILGDAGFNYYLDYRSDELKESFRNIDILYFVFMVIMKNILLILKVIKPRYLMVE